MLKMAILYLLLILKLFLLNPTVQKILRQSETDRRKQKRVVAEAKGKLWLFTGFWCYHNVSSSFDAEMLKQENVIAK